jgi:hypothetical protein
MDIPKVIARREEPLPVMATAKKKIKALGQQRFELEQVEYQEKINQREGPRKIGKKPRGKEPIASTPELRDKDQLSLTDEKTRIVPASRGGFEQC